MKQYIDKFIDLPIANRLAFVFGFLVLIGGGFYYFIIQDIEEGITRATEELDKIEKEILQRSIKVSKLAQFKSEVKRLDSELGVALKELPDRKGIELLLNQVSEKAKEAGLDVLLFKPEEEQKKDFYAEVPVSLEVQGGFNQLAGFFDEVAHLERIVNLTKYRITFDNKASDYTQLRTNLVATSFRFLDPSERPQEDDQKKKRRRK